MHELIAMDKSLVGHIPSSDNAADLVTKVLYGQKQKYMASNIFYDIHKSNWAPVIQFFGMLSDSFDPIGNSIHLEGTINTQQ